MTALSDISDHTNLIVKKILFCYFSMEKLSSWGSSWIPITLLFVLFFHCLITGMCCPPVLDYRKIFLMFLFYLFLF